MPTVPPIIPCIDCRNESDILSSIASSMVAGFGYGTPSQAQVTVAGNNVNLLASGSYQLVLIENTGAANLAVRLASGANSSLANGEILLGPLMGLKLTQFTGQITGACATSTTASVTWSV
jgi:hypothetical protein